MLKKILKRMLMISIIGVTTLSLSGCGEQLKEFAGTTFTQALSQRIQANTDIADDLYEAGYIKEATHTNMVNTLNTQQLFYFGEGERLSFDENDSSGTMFKNSISNYRLLCVCSDYDPGTLVWATDSKRDTIGINAEYYINNDGNKVYDDSGSDWYSPSTLTEYIISNYLHQEFDEGPDSDTGWRDRSNADIMPLDIIGVNPGSTDGVTDDDIEDFIAEGFNLDCKIYILKPNIDSQYLGENYSIDKLCQAIQSDLINGTNNADKVGVINTYFYSPDDITLESLGFDMESLICISEENFDATINTPGYDLVIKQSDQDVLTLRFVEFNQDAVDQFEKIIGAKTGKFYYMDTKDGLSEPALILMEYPVYTFSCMDNLYQDDISINFSTESSLGINLMNGNIIKYSNGTYDGHEYPSDVDSYLTVMNNSSFSILGGYPIQLTAADTFNTNDLTEYCSEDEWPTVYVNTAHIVLTDYLESTYAPGLVDDEIIVNFGRKIRFIIDDAWVVDSTTTKGGVNFPIKKLLIPRNASCAYYIDKDGLRYNGTENYYLTCLDFCDKNALLADTPYVKSIAEGDGYTTNEDSDGTSENIQDLKHTYVESVSIFPTLQFPSSTVGKQDYNSDADNKQLLWCIVTNKGIFGQYSLFSTWITSNSSTASLDWWNDYLTTNNFIYSVGYSEVEEYLMGNFTYELQREGIVILDLDTVAFIQGEMDEEAETERTELIRTIFIVLGWFLIFYSLFLMLAWIIDTNSDIGIDLLTKLTMGNWIAIKYPEDIPGGDLSNTKYISASGITLSCIIIIAVGILIINVDIIKLVMLLINTFGSIAGEIEKMLKGFR